MKKLTYFLGLLIFISSCEKDDLDIPVENKSNSQTENYFNTASKEEVLNHLNQSKSKSPQNIEIFYSEMRQEDLINSNEKITVIPARTKNKNYYSRVLIMKIENGIHSVVYSKHGKVEGEENKFSGEIVITTLDGEFINGFRVIKGTAVSRLRHKEDSLKGSGNCEFHSDGCWIDDDLPEVIVRKPIEPIQLKELYPPEDSGGNRNSPEWDGGSTGGGSLPPTSSNEEEEKIYVELDEKELCAYQRLNYAGVNASNYYNFMTQLFVEFGEGNLGNADLIITSEDLGFSGGKSQYLGDGKFKIIISNMSDRSSIEIAAVILHEMSHAFLAKHYLLYNKSFAELYSMYINDSGLENYSHDIMKDQFLGRMAQTLQDYDSTLFSNFKDYVTLASAGVYSNYSEEKLAEIKNIKNYALQKDSRCTTLKR